jgi:protein-S-isoprenylcysteine O-methyltransferase Ste14
MVELRAGEARVESGVDPFGWFQLAALGLFLGLASYPTVRLRRRHGVSGIVLTWQNWRALAAFGVTSIWASLVIWYAIPGGSRALVAPLDLPYWRWLPLRLFGSVLVAAGATLNLLAHIRLGDDWRLGIDRLATGRFVTTGVYARSRHPIYLFFNLYFAGTVLVEGRPLLLLPWLIVGILLHFEALREEKFLAERFGGAYGRYRSRVRRYWGRRAAS